MSDVEKDILESLRELRQAVAAMPTAVPKPNLIPIFNRLEQLSQQLSKGTDPQLRHYLQNKSYEKAWLLLTGNGEKNVAGSCGKP